MKVGPVLGLMVLSLLLISGRLVGVPAAASYDESEYSTNPRPVSLREPAERSSEAGNEVDISAALAVGPDAARVTIALIAVALAVPLLVAGGGVVYTRLPGTRADRRRTGAVPEEAYNELLRRAASRCVFPLGPDLATSDMTPSAPVDDEAVGWLRLTHDGHRAAKPVNGYPVTVGYSPDCDMVLPSRGVQRCERVRVWQSSGRFMLRSLNGAGNVRVADRPVAWQILEDGDSIEVGDFTVEFEAPFTAAPLQRSSELVAGVACPANAVPS